MRIKPDVKQYKRCSNRSRCTLSLPLLNSDPSQWNTPHILQDFFIKVFFWLQKQEKMVEGDCGTLILIGYHSYKKVHHKTPLWLILCGPRVTGQPLLFGVCFLKVYVSFICVKFKLKFHHHKKRVRSVNTCFFLPIFDNFFSLPWPFLRETVEQTSYAVLGLKLSIEAPLRPSPFFSMQITSIL